MKSPHTSAPGTGPKPRLERKSLKVHNTGRGRNSDEADRRIVAIVKLLARLAAERDFYDDPSEGS